jgi:glycosyltransferase involved in cell wall biosynthesis
MRIICYSSGAWPCGIANYQRHLEPILRQSFSVTTRLLPTTPVLRDRPVALARQRSLYAQLAAESARHDAALLQFITFWNGDRLGENMLPIFVEQLAAPLVVVLHEWPIPQTPEPPGESWPRRVLRSTALRLTPGPRDYESWLRSRFFPRVDHFIVHASELRQRLCDNGVGLERITQVVHPVYELESSAESDGLSPALLKHLEGKRILLLFGFPHPRKNYELAVNALPRLSEDTVLVMAGSTDGPFRSQYVNQLFARARMLGVTHRFHATGEIGSRALADLFARTALAIAPFSYATGSGSLGYFLGARLPIVASNIPSNVDVRRSGGGIELFQQGDAAALADVVAAILEHPERGRRLADQSAAFAAQYNFRTLGEMLGERIADAAAIPA